MYERGRSLEDMEHGFNAIPDDEICECEERIKDKNIYFQLLPKQWYLSFKYGKYLLLKIKLDEGCPYCRCFLPMDYLVVDHQYKGL